VYSDAGRRHEGPFPRSSSGEKWPKPIANLGSPFRPSAELSRKKPLVTDSLRCCKIQNHLQLTVGLIRKSEAVLPNRRSRSLGSGRGRILANLRSFD
jgi:hypothetical protein